MKLKKFNDIFPSNSLLEGFEGYPYRTIIVEVKNIDELEELQLKLGDIYRSVNDLLSSCEAFPNYIFLEPFNFYSTNHADIVYLSSHPDEYSKKKHIYDMKYIDQHIYNMGEWDRIKSILKRGLARPSYTPRKRVLEGVINYPYRFKTEKEFLEEYGENWRNTPNPYWSRAYSGMDVLLGTIYPYTEDELNKNDRPRSEKFTDKNGHDWAIGWWMLTKNIIKPNYIPRKKYID